jgi:hypothetical protein
MYVVFCDWCELLDFQWCFLEIVSSVPELMDPVFAKTSPKRSFWMTENERFGLVSRKLGL